MSGSSSRLGGIRKHLDHVKHLTGKSSLWSIFTSGIGAQILLDGNLMEAFLVHGPKCRLVGEDQFGNRYYENRSLEYNRSRMVIYSRRYDYTPRSIPAEWHAWINYINDCPPTEFEYKQPIYALPMEQDELTGTEKAYHPKGSWLNPERRNWKKYETWVPPGWDRPQDIPARHSSPKR